MIKEARKVAERILNLTGNFPVQVFIRAKKGLLVRFASNGIHQNGFQDLWTYTLRVHGKKGSVYIESNDISELGIRRALRRVRDAVFKPAPFPKFKKRTYSNIKEYFPSPIKGAPEFAASAIEEALDLIHARQATANGYCSLFERFFYLKTSSGRELSHPATAARFGITVVRGAGKGYFSFYHPNPKKLSVSKVVKEADWLAEESSREETAVKPGIYECIFSPRAFQEFLEPLKHHFDRHLYEKGKSVFSDSMGKQVFSDQFSLSDDVTHSGQFGIPFDVEGVERPKVKLIERGVLKHLISEGHSMKGISEHPIYPINLVVPKGTHTLPEMIKRIRKGIFINKIWYHTLMREDNMEVTGLATAGSVYIEHGRIQGRGLNLRYHDSLFSILRSVTETSREQILLKDGETGASLFPYVYVSRLRIV